MKYHEYYKSEIQEHLQNLNENEHTIVIFGASRAGWYIVKVLEHFDIPIKCFVDNDQTKLGNYHNYTVISTDDLAAAFPEATIFLGVFKPATMEVVRNQLSDLGYNKIFYSIGAFLFTYMTEVAKRKCDHAILAQSIHIMLENYNEGNYNYGYTKTNRFVSPFVTGVITQKCSLRCRDCGQRIPYYNKPVNLPVDDVVRDITQYAKAFDVVPEISLHGGEPFLHKQVANICKQVATIPNIVYISFITNGTILPSNEILSQLSECGADILQSDYKTISRKQTDLFQACFNNNIYSEIVWVKPNEKWDKHGKIKKLNRDDADHTKVYRDCVSTKICCQIMAGELWRCPFSMHASYQGKFPKIEGDYVRLNDLSVSDDTLKKRIRSYLTRNVHLSACEYCDRETIEVEPAVQLPPKHKSDKSKGNNYGYSSKIYEFDLMKDNS